MEWNECCIFHYIIIKDSASLIQPALYSIRYTSFRYNHREVLYRIIEEEFKQETEWDREAHVHVYEYVWQDKWP